MGCNSADHQKQCQEIEDLMFKIISEIVVHDGPSQYSQSVWVCRN